MTILYFTATGNSLYVAKSISDKLLSIPQMVKENRYEFSDDKIGIVFPLYEWSVPTFVAEFLKKAKFNTEYLFAVTTYGIFSGGIGWHLNDIADKSNYKFSYINNVLMVDNWIPGFDMKKQIESEYKKNIEKQISKIKLDINTNKKYILPESFLRQTATKLMVKRIEKNKDLSNGIKKTIIVENSCTQCSVCVKVCPVDNIKLDIKNGKIALDNKCFNCFSCVQNCPQNAIHLKNEKSRNRFRNKNVTLAEIINSNN